MSTGYSWEGIRQVRATLLGARHVPERLCGGRVYLGRYIKCSTFTFTFDLSENVLMCNYYAIQCHIKTKPLSSCLKLLYITSPSRGSRLVANCSRLKDQRKHNYCLWRCCEYTICQETIRADIEDVPMWIHTRVFKCSLCRVCNRTEHMLVLCQLVGCV